MHKLTLNHQRDGHAYNGNINLDYEDGGVELSKKLDTFHQFSFARMMARFASAAMDSPDAELIMQRTEREDLEPILLDESTSKTLREDPASVIASMSVDHRTVERAKVALEATVKTQDDVKLQLRAGHDTMADAFGDYIYLKLRPHDKDGMQGECPFSGKWAGFGANANNTSQFLLKTGRQNAHKDWVPVELVGGSKTENPKWVRVKTEELLSHTMSGEHPDKFFIPRKWNKTSPWIDREELETMYIKYKKEKEACSDDSKG